MRSQDWHKRLDDFIVKHENKKFVWGKLDCVLFAGGVIKALTGKNVIKNYSRYKYKDKLSAYKIIKKHFKNDSNNIFNDILGNSNTNINKAKVGDIACVLIENEKCYGVIADNGLEIILLDRKSGLVRHKLSDGVRFWEVR